MNKQNKRAGERDVGTAWNEFEREREGDERRERESEGWKRSLEEQCCFFGFAATQTTPKAERGGSFLPSLGFSSFL